ncbi:phenylalanine--tRNA ligase subunit alpha [Acidianus sulfidivorans JP7]|uniref:Phenylalanine--tRNA ligase alpha subunit n=1 Tax=Acidianus sulfidivorans JP7 TaxID=619593 RepID=A0A2U9IM58_9CREN|nr:phenylalanine--tRNA ligase subunit alpha [Acidianus sulfidivorans]AWR97101.1 phenylalanine--tRNA ligase subunit alpha [Acidianus sulfidivorans JP7]
MLSENEIKVIEYLKEHRTASSIELSSIIPESSVYSIVYLLQSKGYVSVEEKNIEKYELTKEGEERLKNGLPEDILLSLLKDKPKSIQEISSSLGKDTNIALSWAKRKGLIRIQDGIIYPLNSNYTSPELSILRKIKNNEAISDEEINKYIKELIERKLINVKKVKIITVSLLKEPKETNAITFLTPEILQSGNWKKYTFREYNVEALPPFLPIGKKHYFKEFLEHVKDIMISLGFTEIKSNYVELEFYNFDMLFQAQDHPAREIHDSFRISGYGKLPENNLVERVKEVHEKWWKYKWSENIAKNLVLRSQTTATTARMLSTSPDKSIRTFTIGKVFRPDAIDATHLIEFHQLDGLIIENNFNFRELLSILKSIFYELGIKEIKFKPGYFPFTEPSVEIYGYMQNLGWVEMAGAGLLRPEVTEPALVNMPAGAWGLGLDRLAMLFLGIKDIRYLYSDDLEYLRNRKVEY